jgi:hypothetical protein
MDLLTILGNALADDKFLDQLFDDPLGTVKRYGFRLTRVELDALKDITQGTRAKENKTYFQKIYTCPRRPCLYALARPEDLEDTQQKPTPMPKTGT